MYTNLARFLSLSFLSHQAIYAHVRDQIKDNTLQNGNENNTFVLKGSYGVGADCEYNPCNQAFDPYEMQWVYYKDNSSYLILSYDICATAGQGAVIYDHDKPSCAKPTGEWFNVTTSLDSTTVVGSSNVKMGVTKKEVPLTDEDGTIWVNQIKAHLTNSIGFFKEQNKLKTNMVTDKIYAYHAEDPSVIKPK